MQIYVIDESRKKAWRHSRRVLAAHLTRHGSRTFAGKVPRHEVPAFVQNLRDIGANQSKIAIYHLTEDSDFVQIARIGADDAGPCVEAQVHKLLMAPPLAPKSFAPMVKILRVLDKIAALFHDLGKTGELFQGKLRSGLFIGERLRHELLSYLMLKQWAATASANGNNWLDALAQDSSLLKSMQDQVTITVPAAFKDWALSSGPAPELMQKEAYELLGDIATSDDVFLPSLLWLVLTHHRQIGCTPLNLDEHAFKADTCLPTFADHANSGLPPSELNLEVHRSGAPWYDVAWLKEVQSDMAELQSLIKENPSVVAQITLNREAWSHNLALIGRGNLVLADYIASAQKSGNPNADDRLLYANTAKNDKGENLLADTLPVHLLKARNAVSPLFSLVHGEQGQLPTLDIRALPMMLANTPVPQKFEWQREAAMKVANHPNIGAKPIFGMIISGTGAGKTVAGPKILGAARGKYLRYTSAFGLRSLTLQTGISYRTLMDIPAESLLTVVGDTLYAKFAVSPGANAGVSEQECSGSESLAVEVDVMFDRETSSTGHLARALGLDPEVASSVLRGAKSLSMVEVAVLACTVDHLMRASVLDSGGDVLMMLRLATSDLILDEIDNYSQEDLQALVRLVHAVGCHGRSVILMSATVSETVLASLHAAWLKGIEEFQLRTEGTENPVLALVSNYLPAVLHEGRDAAKAEAAMKSYVAQMCAAILDGPLKNQACPLLLNADGSLRDAFDAIYAQAVKFSKKHYTLDPDTHKRLSTGFVRFNTVRHARQFVFYLHEMAAIPEKLSVRTQCYHRRIPMLHMSLIERMLNKMMSRQVEKGIFACSEIAGWMQDEPAAEDYLFIVATTSIQETGRDHDYDWAIGEPWSTRSLIQLAGRVLRHRTKFAVDPNIAVMSCNLSDVEGTRDKRSSGRMVVPNSLELSREPLREPRVSTEIPTFNWIIAPLHKKFKTEWTTFRAIALPLLGRLPSSALTDRTQWMPPTLFSRGIQAGPCLSLSFAEGAVLPELEHFAQARRMGTGVLNPKRLSSKSVLTSTTREPANGSLVAEPPICELLWRRHAEAIVFRRQSGDLQQFTLNPAASFRKIAHVVRTSKGEMVLLPRLDPKNGQVENVLRNPQRSLLRLDLITEEQTNAELAAAGVTSDSSRGLSHSFEVYMRDGEQFTGFLDYEPLLGADTCSFRI